MFKSGTLLLIGEAATLQGAIAQAQSLLYLSDSSAFSMEAQAKPAPASFISLAWLIKGLYMAGHAGAFDLAMLPIQYLVSSRTTATLFSQADSLHGNSAMESTAKVSDSTAQQKPADLRPTEDDSDVAETQAAAALVYQLVPAGIQDGVLSFSKDLAHTKQKPLWQQRFFTQILQQLQQRLTSTATSATVDVATNGHQQGSPDLAAQEEHLLVALAHLVNGTPAHVVKPALPGLVGLLLRALDVLQKERHSKVSLLLLAMLRALESVLHEAPGMLCMFLSHLHCCHVSSTITFCCVASQSQCVEVLQQVDT